MDDGVGGGGSWLEPATSSRKSAERSAARPDKCGSTRRAAGVLLPSRGSTLDLTWEQTRSWKRLANSCGGFPLGLRLRVHLREHVCTSASPALAPVCVSCWPAGLSVCQLAAARWRRHLLTATDSTDNQRQPCWGASSLLRWGALSL